MNNNRILRVDHLAKEYEDTIPLKDITFDIFNGDVVSIIGPSGIGKSTILRCINRLENPTSGKILLHGEEIGKSLNNIINARKKIGMVFQKFNLFNNFSVIDNIAKPQIDILKKDKDVARQHSLELLESIGLQHKADNQIQELSGGQQQRVAILRSIAIEPELLLLDEPTSALDPSSTNEVIKIIKHLASTKMTMIIVTHEMQLAKNLSNRVFYLDEGVIYEEGSTHDIFENPKREKTIEFVKNVKINKYSMSLEDFDYVQFITGVLKHLASNRVNNLMIMKINLVLEEIISEAILPSETFSHISCITKCNNFSDQVNCEIEAQLVDNDIEKYDERTIINKLFSEASLRIISGIASKHSITLNNNMLKLSLEITQ